MTNRNQDSNCSSFNNKTMFDDFNGFVGGSRNSFSGRSNMPINWSNAKGKSSGDRPCTSTCKSCLDSGHLSSACNSNGKCCGAVGGAKQINRKQKAIKEEEKVIVEPIQSTGLAESECGSVQCFCENGQVRRGRIRYCNTNCDRCFELACRNMCRNPIKAEKTNSQTQNFTGMGSTFPKGSGSYFDGNNRMRQGRAMDNGGLRLR